MSTVDAPLRNINNVIHELGHVFNIMLGRVPVAVLSSSEYSSLIQNNAGFYGPANNNTWQPSLKGNDPNEIFANQFVGWAHNKWASDAVGPLRADFMRKMDTWAPQAAGYP